MPRNFMDLYKMEADEADRQEEKEWEEMDEDYKRYLQEEADADEERWREEEENRTDEEREERKKRKEYLESISPSEENAKKMEHTRNDYCKEDTFETMVLNKLFPGKNWVHNKTIPGAPRRTRPDFRCDELKLIVEYNGHRHYTQASTILADAEKRKMYEAMGYTVVEWPYWLQPDKNTVRTYFGKYRARFSQHFCNFHQGFVSKDCVLPADFCELGVERYNYELSCQDAHTIIRVLWSLENKEQLYGAKSVWCSRGGLIAGSDYYIDDTRFWWRKIHSFGYDESMEIGSSVI